MTWKLLLSFALIFICAAFGFIKTASSDDALLFDNYLDSKLFLTKIFENETEVFEYQIGLSALQKIRGSWQFKNSIRHSGLVLSQTWQVKGSYTSEEVFGLITKWISENFSSKALFQCKGRSCGSSSQWASRVFESRLLYGLSLIHI